MPTRDREREVVEKDFELRDEENAGKRKLGGMVLRSGSLIRRLRQCGETEQVIFSSQNYCQQFILASVNQLQSDLQVPKRN